MVTGQKADLGQFVSIFSSLESLPRVEKIKALNPRTWSYLDSASFFIDFEKVIEFPKASQYCHLRYGNNKNVYLIIGVAVEMKWDYIWSILHTTDL